MKAKEAEDRGGVVLLSHSSANIGTQRSRSERVRKEFIATSWMGTREIPVLYEKSENNREIVRYDYGNTKIF